MSSKESKYREDKANKESKYDDDDDDDDELGGSCDAKDFAPPKIEVLSISYEPKGPSLIDSSMRLKIKFEVDRYALICLLTNALNSLLYHY